MTVHLLWQQSNAIREIAHRVPLSEYYPKLVGVYSEETLPQRLADEYNETHQYSSQWVTSQSVR